MNTTRIRKKSLTAVVGAAIAVAAAPALLFLAAGTAQAFNPQPDPPGVSGPGTKVGVEDPNYRAPQIGNPDTKVGIGDPGIKVGLGGPDTRPGG